MNITIIFLSMNIHCIIILYLHVHILQVPLCVCSLYSVVSLSVLPTVQSDLLHNTAISLSTQKATVPQNTCTY